MKAALKRSFAWVALAALICAWSFPAGAQARGRAGRSNERGASSAPSPNVRSVTIPVTLRLREPRAQTEIQPIEFLRVFEDGEEQEILSLRGGVRSPLSLALLVQDDLTSSVAVDVKNLSHFVRRLPPGSRVLVGYLRGGALQVRQRFTTDLERAARSVRPPVGSSSVAPASLYQQTIEALRRFESQPAGRRAVLLVSSGLDLSRGLDSSSPGQQPDLQRAIAEAQRRGVAVFALYAPSAGGGSALSLNGQGALQRLAGETGGRAYFQGLGAPVSFDPFLRDIGAMLPRLFALTYLSTHADRGGFHEIKIVADLKDGEIMHPKGYTR